MELILLVLLIAILIMLIVIYLKFNHNESFKRLEKGIEQNERELIASKSYHQSLAKSYEILLGELSKTKEYLGVSDAKLNLLTKTIRDMNAVMVNTKKRGNFGEYQLYHLLSLYLGHSSLLYETQYHLSNGKIADAILHIPNQKQVLCIDSKFPSENYLRLVDDPSSLVAKRELRKNVKKHIHDICEKYIIPQETSEEAIMFIPSEAIYLYLWQEEPELIEEAHRHHVMMTSPSTLMGVTMTFLAIIKDFQRAQNIEKIEKQLIALKEDSDRMILRYEKAYKSAHTLIKQLDELHISMDKINNKIQGIYEGEEKDG